MSDRAAAKNPRYSAVEFADIDKIMPEANASGIFVYQKKVFSSR